MKDPRMLLVLDGWCEALPKARFVGSFRHPDAVAASLAKRGDHSEEQGQALWLAYNTRLLTLLRERPFPLIDFDQKPDDYVNTVTRLCVLFSLTPPKDGFTFFDTALRNNWTRRPLPEHPDVRQIYEELLDFAQSW